MSCSINQLCVRQLRHIVILKSILVRIPNKAITGRCVSVVYLCVHMQKMRGREERETEGSRGRQTKKQRGRSIRHVALWMYGLLSSSSSLRNYELSQMRNFSNNSNALCCQFTERAQLFHSFTFPNSDRSIRHPWEQLCVGVCIRRAETGCCTSPSPYVMFKRCLMQSCAAGV